MRPATGGPALRRPTRRVVLAGGIAIAGSGPLAALAGCTPPPPPPPPPPDPFEPLIASATEHAELAEAVAAAHPSLAAAARQVAVDRRVHADALAAEVRRATPSPVTSAPSPAGPSSGASSGGTIGSPAPVDPAAARTALLGAATNAQRQAADLVAGLPRYRAGLVASIAACCASHTVVLG